MAQKSGAVKALTGGIAHLFKQNKVGLLSVFNGCWLTCIFTVRTTDGGVYSVTSPPSGDPRQWFWEGDG